ncbi:MAG: hypothetical protein ACI8ZM_004142 [Crocinitomix sp.]|jgi:hypothetical protein
MTKKQTTWSSKVKNYGLNSCTFLIIGFASFTSFSQITDPAPYCESIFYNNYNSIQDITINETTLSFGSEGELGDFNDYAYYNETSFPDLELSGTAEITINFFSVNYTEPDYFALWIDYNQNDVFESEEIVMQNANTTMDELPEFGLSDVEISLTITIPDDALTGETRARLIRGARGEGDPFGPYDSTYELDPCTPAEGFWMHGCTYDFDLNITEMDIDDASIKDLPQISANIYPNPTDGNITVAFAEVPSEEYLVQVIGVDGKVVLTESVQLVGLKLNLDLMAIESGIYTLLIVSDKNELKFSKRFCKQ